MDVMATTEYLARSTTFTSVGIIGYIIIGGLAG
ncbi:MAG: GlsB/YeaQ/YmgE family stress response membrane protein, partial [Mycobacterium sp.]